MENVKNYLLENIDELKSAVNDLNSYDGSLEYLEMHYNDEEFFNTFFEGNPMEAVRASHYGEYRFMDEYVQFNGYGNLKSYSEYDYHEELKDSIDDIVEVLIDNKHNVDLSSELEVLLSEGD